MRGKYNRLAEEKSPYLLQHADNPVDWYPWCQEAFEKAKREGKPVFLSIGYSTCHWCHVMAHESFEDEEVARVLNTHFVSIKVDREERPDVDAVYMTACQALTGSGGWPLTVLMDEEGHPFYVGTYLPKKGRYGRLGLLDLLDAVWKQWQEDPAQLKESGQKITEHLKALEVEDASEEYLESRIGEKLLAGGVRWFERQFDEKWGGFGRAPKFPQAHQLVFLLRYGAWKKEKRPVEMAEATLFAMYRGGIFDQIGGGFSRYSTDDQWLVPHFEKMLYDNALLADAYLEAFSKTGREEYGDAARRIFMYVERELLQKEGGFSCGQDADSQQEEGKYYLFTREEILDVLGPERGEIFCEFYDITEEGNFEGKNIPNRIGRETQERPFWWQEALDLLLDYRKSRMELHLDDKVLTSWNSLMIGAYAKAAVVLQDSHYEATARKAMSFLRRHLKDSKGNLQIRWRDGQAAFPGQLEDYAFYALACLDMHEAFGEKEEFLEAIWAVKQLQALFADREGGGYFRYSDKNEALIIRPKEIYDGAIPSGNGAAALAFARLYGLTGDTGLRDLRDAQLHFLEQRIQSFPAGYTMTLLAILESLQEQTVCGIGDESEACKMQAKRYQWMGEGLNLKN